MKRVKRERTSIYKEATRNEEQTFGKHLTVRYCAPPFEKMRPLPEVPPLKEELERKKKRKNDIDSFMKLNKKRIVTLDDLK